MFAWSAFPWRWLSKRRQGVPKVVVAFFGFSYLTLFFNLSEGNFFAVPGVHDNYFTRSQAIVQEELDSRKIKILAQRKAKLAQDRLEAEAYFAEHGFTSRSTNEFVRLKDYQAY
mmetsp:Transcript_4697/g.8838  ORF Transcript_4697/g.8838 Transcript_4697/m.8838 type:complete len:114 (+) Transcript_4697:247-588(+)